MDTGAQVSLIHYRVYNNLVNKPKLRKTDVHMQSANGSALQVYGCINVPFKVGGINMTQDFYVVGDLNRNVILGLDWLKRNNVRIYFDLHSLRINGKTYVNLEEDIHIASTVRMKNTYVIKPQSASICHGKLRQNPDIPAGHIYEISEIDKGFFSREPGLQVINTVGVLQNDRSIPLLIVNNTNKTYRLHRHGLVAKVHSVNDSNILDISSVIKNQKQEFNLNLQDLNVPDEHRPDIEKLIKENHDLFANKDSELGQTDTVKMKIDTGNTQPIKLKPYRTPINNRKIIDQAIDEMLEADIIQRSRSPWSFPVVIVPKKDGSKRFCVDFRKLNLVTKKNSWPLPMIDDLISVLNKAKYFTSLDLKSGYWQIALDPKDQEKTAFSTFRGLHEFKVMPFGLSNAPALFQELMSIVLEGLGHFSVCYLDDILLFSESLEEHKKHIEITFDRLRKHGLKLKLKKCSFLQTETNYLGFVINQNGIMPDSKKVEAIRSLPEPTCVREVRSFIGMCSYYRRFIPNFSGIAEVIIELTRKNAHFKWTSAHQEAFEYIKESLTVVPLLFYCNPNRPFILYTDASQMCIGACLTQMCNEDESGKPLSTPIEKPIYYLSHKLSKTQCKWSTVEKEAYAIHYALQKLDYYLHNAEFVIKTDHKPLKYLLESPMQNRKVQLWALSMAGYNCTIEYLPGPKNFCADLLSRHPKNVGKEIDSRDSSSDSDKVEMDVDVHENTYNIQVIDSNQFDPKQVRICEEPDKEPFQASNYVLDKGLDMEAEQGKDDELVEIKASCLRDSKKEKRYIVIDNILYYITDVDDDPVCRLYVPKHLRLMVIKQYHDENGHMGVQKTFEGIRMKYFWPHLFKELYQYVNDCVTCQTRSLQKIRQPLQETELPPYAMAKVSLDLSGPYPTTMSNNKYIVSFVCWYSCFPEAFAVPDKTADTISYLILNEIFPRYGSMLQIVTDNGSENVNQVMKETLEALNIHHIKTSVYHPASNAKVERMHRTLADILAKRVWDSPNTWDLHLNQALAAIRFNVNESTKFSPFHLLFNRDVVLPIDNIMRPRPKYYGEDNHKITLQAQHQAFMMVRKNMKKAKRKQAKYHDRGVKQMDYQIGDPVYYKNNRRKGKLDVKWHPYHRIIEKTGPVSYVIKNQLDGSTSRVHAEQLRLANLEKWDIPKPEETRLVRRNHYVVSPESDSESENSSLSSNSDDKPLSWLAKRHRKQRSNSSSEDEIPLLELSRRWKSRRQNQNEGGEQNIDSDRVHSDNLELDRNELEIEQPSAMDMNSDPEIEVEEGMGSPESMVVDQATIVNSSHVKKSKRSLRKSTKPKVKGLLRLISDML